MRFGRIGKSESGQSLVEFALIVPVLLLLLLGIIEFGWLFNGQITVTSAAREGSRKAAVAAVQFPSQLTTQERNSIENAVRNHIEGLSGLQLTGFEVRYDGLFTDLGDVPDQPNSGEAAAYVVFVPEAGNYTEVRVFIKGKMSWLTGFFGFLGDATQLGAKSVMRKE